MKHILRLATIALLAGILMNQPAFADPPPGKGNTNKGNHDSNGNKGNNDLAQGNPKGSTSDLALNLVVAGITAFAAQNLALKYGVASYPPLPHGIAKNLARGKPLPPGIAKKYPPTAMLNQLPFHPGYEWRIAGSDLILVAIGTAIVADVLRNVFR